MAAILFLIQGSIFGGLMIWCAFSRRPWAVAAREFVQNGKGPLVAFGGSTVLLTLGSIWVLLPLIIVGLNYFDPDEHHPGADLIIILFVSFAPLFVCRLIASVWRNRRN
jgi:hypothetical protein